jgi:hypothetical protein
MTGHVEALLEAVQRLVAVRIDRQDAGGSAEVRVGACLIARIDGLHSQVFVYLPADRIPDVRRMFPSSRETAGGLVFDIADPRSASEALAAIRRRAHVETFAPQFRVASP